MFEKIGLADSPLSPEGVCVRVCVCVCVCACRCSGGRTVAGEGWEGGVESVTPDLVHFLSKAITPGLQKPAVFYGVEAREVPPIVGRRDDILSNSIQ